MGGDAAGIGAECEVVAIGVVAGEAITDIGNAGAGGGAAAGGAGFDPTARVEDGDGERVGIGRVY